MQASERESPGKVVVFYSFKGGAGRSMALVNVACVLAARHSNGGPILVIDWDLEAPGLHRFLSKLLFKAFGGNEDAQRKHPGLIDLFVHLEERLGDSRDQSPQDNAAALALLSDLPWREYVIKTDRPRLHLLKAGAFDEAYARKVAGFDWQRLYARSPHLLRVLSEQMARDYTWVFIDSRTGLTYTSGICTMLMPETLVAVFTPNIQNLEGVVDLVGQAGRNRARSEDLRPLVVYPLPSRIEASEPALRKQWRFGDNKLGIIGYQPMFEKTLQQIYGLERCNLKGYFDEVQTCWS